MKSRRNVLDANGRTEAEFLAGYDLRKYKQPSVTTDVVALSVQDQPSENVRRPGGSKVSVLLIKRGGHPFIGQWALPGGFLRENETVEGCAARELAEETQLSGQVLLPVGVFSKPGRDPRGWIVSNAYLAIVPKSESAVSGGDDAAEARWFPIEDVLSGKIKLAFDHLDIITAAIGTLRPVDRTEWAFAFLPPQFTMAELKTVYDFIDGKAQTAGNFRRRIMPLVEASSEKLRGVGYRPAALFKRKAN